MPSRGISSLRLGWSESLLATTGSFRSVSLPFFPLLIRLPRALCSVRVGKNLDVYTQRSSRHKRFMFMVMAACKHEWSTVKSDPSRHTAQHLIRKCQLLRCCLATNFSSTSLDVVIKHFWRWSDKEEKTLFNLVLRLACKENKRCRATIMFSGRDCLRLRSLTSWSWKATPTQNADRQMRIKRRPTLSFSSRNFAKSDHKWGPWVVKWKKDWWIGWNVGGNHFTAPFALDAGEQMNRMEMKVGAAAHSNDGSVPKAQAI